MPPLPARNEGTGLLLHHLKDPGPAVCPNGHAMDDGLFECPACGAYRASGAARTKREQDAETARMNSPRWQHPERPWFAGERDV